MSGVDSLHIMRFMEQLLLVLKILNFNSKKIDLITGGFEIISQVHNCV
jgi:hypothetical protein